MCSPLSLPIHRFSHTAERPLRVRGFQVDINVDISQVQIQGHMYRILTCTISLCYVTSHQ